MLDSDLKRLLVGKTIKDIEFNYGMSAHCNFVKSIIFTDGTKLYLSVIAKSDFIGHIINKGMTVLGKIKEC